MLQFEQAPIFMDTEVPSVVRLAERKDQHMGGTLTTALPFAYVMYLCRRRTPSKIPAHDAPKALHKCHPRLL
jgi:hypothetical protein